MSFPYNPKGALGPGTLVVAESIFRTPCLAWRGWWLRSQPVEVDERIKGATPESLGLQ